MINIEVFYRKENNYFNFIFVKFLEIYDFVNYIVLEGIFISVRRVLKFGFISFIVFFVIVIFVC